MTKNSKPKREKCVKRDEQGRFIKGSYYGYWKGKKMPPEMCEKFKNRPTCRGKSRNYTPEEKERNANQLADARSKRKSINNTEEQRTKISKSNIEHNQECAKLKQELELEGYNVIDTGVLKPDLIAIKDGKIIAYEVEYGNPRYYKYEGCTVFNDIIWHLRSRRTGKEIVKHQTMN